MTEKMRAIPRHELQRLAAKYGYGQLIILGINEGPQHLISEQKTEPYITIDSCRDTFSKDGIRSKTLKKVAMILENLYLKMYKDPRLIDEGIKRIKKELSND